MKDNGLSWSPGAVHDGNRLRLGWCSVVLSAPVQKERKPPDNTDQSLGQLNHPEPRRRGERIVGKGDITSCYDVRERSALS